MLRRLQFGSGQHKLPPPWENFDRDVDITEALPFPTACAELILAEHVIEHVPFERGLFFLRQCRRVLAPGGVLRLCFPDITRMDEPEPATMASLKKLGVLADDLGDLWRAVLCNWGHESCWTEKMGKRVLLALGFSGVDSYRYSQSNRAALQGIDGHHKSVPFEVALYETTVLEATH